MSIIYIQVIAPSFHALSLFLFHLSLSFSILIAFHNFVGQRILKAGKLTEKVVKLFIATGKDEVLSLVQELNIQHILTPVLPTSELF